MVEWPISQRDCTCEAGHDGAQSRLPRGATIILAHPEATGMGDSHRRTAGSRIRRRTGGRPGVRHQTTMPEDRIKQVEVDRR